MQDANRRLVMQKRTVLFDDTPAGNAAAAAHMKCACDLQGLGASSTANDDLGTVDDVSDDEGEDVNF